MASYLDSTGLAQMWADIKAYITRKRNTAHIPTNSTTYPIGTNCNNELGEWHLGGSSGSSNYPSTSQFFYVNTIQYTNTVGDVNAKQIAYGYTTDVVYTRYKYGGAWGSWQELQPVQVREALSITRNTTNTTAIVNKSYVYPDIGLGVIQARFTCAAFAAGAAKTLGTIATYVPATSVVGVAMHGTTANSCKVYLYSADGSIVFKNAAAVAAGDYVYVTITWNLDSI